MAGRAIALAGALALMGGCTTSELLIETARAIQESESGSADPTAHGAVLQPTADARVLQVQEGDAVWYGAAVHGNLTASGEIFDRNGMTAAHNSFPFESLVRVTNLRNGRQVTVRITDRGAFREPRIIDVSERAAELLGFKSAGVTPVRLELLSTAGVASR
jgi:rare lipoprotein A